MTVWKSCLAFAWLGFGHGSKWSTSEYDQPFLPPHRGHLRALVSQSLAYFRGGLLAPTIQTYGSGYTLACLQAAAAEITPFTPHEKGLCPATSSPCSSRLRGRIGFSSGAERGRLIGAVSALHAWFLPWPERRGTAPGFSLRAEWQRRRQGHPAPGPRAWPPRAGRNPRASWPQQQPVE